jgi:hypothetical protein
MKKSLLLVSAAIALAAPASAQQAKLPTKLVGTWTRTVKSTDIAREGASDLLVWKGRWKIAIAANGTVTLYSPRDPKNFDAVWDRTLSAGATKLTFSRVSACSAPGTYTYALAGANLSLKLVSDPSCSARRALLIGVWHRAAA